MQLEQIKIAITMDDGNLNVMSFVTVGRGNRLPEYAEWIESDGLGGGWWRRETTDVAVLSELNRAFPMRDPQGNTLPQPRRFRRIADADVPSERAYRGAWFDTGTGIEHDMDKARELHLEKLRAARSKRLEELDRAWMKATGQGRKSEAKTVEAERQALRDLPVRVREDLDAAKTIEDLKIVR